MVKYCRRRGGGGVPTPQKIPKLPFLGKLFRFRGGGSRPPVSVYRTIGPLVSLRVATIGILYTEKERGDEVYRSAG